MKITVIKPQEVQKQKKKVAAYARVSTFSEEQEESFESQVEYYKALITRNANYEFVEVYADQGISGTQTKTRPNFMRMIEDAKSGKIDIIYCKSISRFCRNAAQCQEIVRELKTNLVEVIFEKEQLSSFNPMSEMVFNFMTIIAQEESRSISENTIWALDRLAERGIRRIGSNAIFGYKEVDGVLTPNEYAPAVKMIFEEYAQGTRVKDILKYLDQMGVVKLYSKTKMNSEDIRRMLKNVIYKGERIIQQKPHRNYLTKKPDYTKPFNQYYITEAHEPIVSPELWEACQVEHNRRKKEAKYGNPIPKPIVFRYPNSHILFGKLVCAECGSPFERITKKNKNFSRKMWRCKKKYGHCENHYIREEELLEKIGDVDLNLVDKVLVNKDGTISIVMVKYYLPLVAISGTVSQS